MYKKAVLLTVLAAGLGVLGFAAAGFIANDTIPGYVHRNGAGSRVDVRADGTHDGTAWTVVFTRNLNTGDPGHDIQFEAGNSYDFQVAIWDNAGDEAHDTSEMTNVFTMDVPAAPGPLAFSGTPGFFETLVGEYLASGEIQITAQWLDETKDDNRKAWIFDGELWNQSSENEDRAAFIWDMQEDGFESAGTCLTMCHMPDRMYTAPDTLVDTWQWKAGRTNPSGYADDKYWDDGAAGTASGRHSDPGQSTYSDNSGAPPSFMSEDDPGANASFIFQFQEGVKEAVPWADGTWIAGDFLPGYAARRGSGSRVDTRATATHDGDEWSVTIRRKLDTGDAAHDITFALGGTYYFQVALFDNTGDAGHDTSQMSSVFSMTLPGEPGAITFGSTPTSFSSLTGELLASDEIEITASWPDATRNDLRKSWMFDGADWSQSSDNEDRVAFIWDMQNDEFASAGTCLAMCHLGVGMFTAPGTFVDTWHFKATRTGATGFCDDKYWDDGAGGTASGRHSDQGTSVYADNADNEGVPTFMSAHGPGTSAKFLFGHTAAAGWSRAVPFSTSTGCAGPTYWTEIAAHAPGFAGSQWRTDLVAKNTAVETAVLEITLHTSTGDHMVPGTVDPMAQAIFEDIVGIIGIEDKGALEICSTQPLILVSRIYNQAVDGTFGQFVDGYTTSDGLALGETAWLPALRQQEGVFRTNISVTNTSGEAAEVQITLYGTDASELHTYSLSVDPGEVVQDIEPFKSRANQPDLGWGFAAVEVTVGSGILTSASVVDSVTNDATTIPMKR